MDFCCRTLWQIPTCLWGWAISTWLARAAPANPWAAVGQGNRFGTSVQNNRTLASQGLPNNFLGSASLGNPGIQGLQGFQANIGLQAGILAMPPLLQRDVDASLPTPGTLSWGMKSTLAWEKIRTACNVQGFELIARQLPSSVCAKLRTLTILSPPRFYQLPRPVNS